MPTGGLGATAGILSARPAETPPERDEWLEKFSRPIATMPVTGFFQYDQGRAGVPRPQD